MSDPASPPPTPTTYAGMDGWLAFSLLGERFALPMAAVEAVAPPPPVALVPHAAPALLGVANFAGRIVPIVDLARLLERRRADAVYDGGGEILRLRFRDGSIGLWVDRVERLIAIDSETPAPEDLVLLDPGALLEAAFEPPALAAGGTAPLGEVADVVAATAATTTSTAESSILVEVAHQQLHLGRDAVVELIETVPWTPVPRAPAGLLGVGVLRGAALPVLSLATLLGLPEYRVAGGFAVVELLGHRALLAVDRVVGLRVGESRDETARGEPAAADGEPIDIVRTIPEELRRIVMAFAPTAGSSPSWAAENAGKIVEYLSFTVGDRDFAVPVASVDRVVAGQPVIGLPRPTAGEFPSRVIGVMELSGRILPVAGPRSCRASDFEGATPPRPDLGAYVIFRGPEGLGAIAVDRIRRVVAVRSDELAPPEAGDDLIAAVAAPAAGERLHIIAPELLWGAG